MTKFKVVFANGKSTKYKGDYKIDTAGVLAIKPDRGNPVLYSPSGWVSIEVTDGPDYPVTDSVV